MGSDSSREPSPEKSSTRFLRASSDAVTGARTPPGSLPMGGGLPLNRHQLEQIALDMQSAAEFQRSLLPRGLPMIAGYDFGVTYAGAKPISGDYYDFLPHPDGQLGVVIADASGKGLTAGLLITMLRALLHARPEEAVTPQAILSFLNEKLYPQVKRGMFVSMTYGLLDPVRHVLALGNAGHLPTVIWRAATKSVTMQPAHGVVLGAGAAALFDSHLQVDEVTLEVGDRVLLITDGVNEAMAPGQREFGMDHLRRRLQADAERTSAEFIKNIVAQIDIHRSGGEQSDDITIVTFRRLT
ncbi:MAG: serine/threonine-protein phosphatase [Planctomycetes bacterium]|nr:serine/threonine-protein phosphatase [Planctomycetota bacterium]